MPNIAAAFESTNPIAQAVGCGIPAPAIVFQPGGTRAANVYTTEALLAQIVQASFGMNGPFPVYLDFTQNSDAYTASGTLGFGSHGSVCGVVNQTSGALPALTTAHAITPPAEIRDVALSCSFAGSVFSTVPKLFKLSGSATLACASGTTLYTVSSSGYKVFVSDAATLGDGTHAVLAIGAAGGLALYIGSAATLAAGALTITAGGAVTIYASPGAGIDPSYVGMSGVTIVGGGGGGGGGGGAALDVYASSLTTLETGLAAASSESYAVSRFYCNFGAVTLPSGSYNPGLISEWIADPTAGTAPAVTLAAGVTFTHFPYRLRGVTLESPSSPTGAVFSGAALYCELVNGGLTSAASIAHPIVDVSAETATFDLRGSSQIAGTAGGNTSGIIDMVTPASGFTVVVNLYDSASLGVASFGSALLTYAGAHVGALRIVRYSPATEVLDANLLPYVVDAFVGAPAPAVVFQPGGTANGTNLVTSEVTLNQLASAVGAPCAVRVDLSQAGTPDHYTTAASLSLGANSALRGVPDQSTGVLPVLVLAHSISAPAEIADISLTSTVSGSAFATNPLFFRLSGRANVGGGVGPLFHVVNATSAVVLIEDEATLASTAITVDNGGSLTVYVSPLGSLASGAITVSSGGTLTIYATTPGSVDKSYYGATGVTVSNLATPAALTAVNTGTTVVPITFPAKTLTAVTSSNSVVVKLPAVATIPDNWDVTTILETGGNALTVEVEGTASEQLLDPTTGLAESSWSSAASGNKANTQVTWRWYKTGNTWASIGNVSSSAGLGTAGQILVTNSSATAAAWVSASGDATMTAAGVVTVDGIRGAAIPSLAQGYLAYNGSNFTFASAANAPLTVTYQPGGTATGNTFTSWTALLTYVDAAITAGYAGSIVYQFDDSYGTITVSGAIPGTSITWVGIGNLNGTPVTVASGTTFPGFSGAAYAIFRVRGCSVTNLAAGIATTSGVGHIVIFEVDNFGGWANQSTGSAAFSITLGAFALVYVTNTSTITANPHPPMIQLDTGHSSQLVCFCNVAGTVGTDAFGGAANITVNLNSGSQCGAQTTYGSAYLVATDDASTVGAISGGTVTFSSVANHLGYSPATPGNWGTLPNQAAAALDYLAARLGTAPLTVTYAPGGTAAGTTFTSWSTLITYVNAAITAGYNGTIIYQFDDSNGSISISGAIPGTTIKFVGIGSQYIGTTSATVTIASGTTFSSWTGVELYALELSHVQVINDATTIATISGNGALGSFVLDYFATWRNQGTGAAFSIGTDAIAYFYVFDNSSILANPHPPMVLLQTGVGASLICTCFNSAQIGTDAFGAGTAGQINVTLNSGSSIASQSTYGANYNVTASADCSVGTISGGTVAYSSKAAQTAYSPGTPGNWLSVPALVSTALDYLAAHGGISALTGDVTASGSGSVAATVTAIRGNTVASGALTKGYFLGATSTSSWAAVAISGDVSASASTVGDFTVTGLQGVAVPSPTTGVLYYNGAAYSWASIPSAITWASDLASSTTANQWVSGLSGSGGAGGTITVGDGIHATSLVGKTSQQSSPPTIALHGSTGYAASNANGGFGGEADVTGGTGGAGTGTNKSGGEGGPVVLTGGGGGASTGTAANAAGGDVDITTGPAGTGGSGAAGSPGQFSVSIGGDASCIQLQENALSDYVAIGGSPGTGSGHTAQSGYLRFPKGTSSVPIVTVRNKSDSGDDAVLDSEVLTGSSYVYLGGTNDVTTIRAGSLVQTYCAEARLQGPSAPFFLYTRKTGQGTASSQNGNVLDDIGLVTVGASSTAGAYTFSIPTAVSCIVRVSTCARATTAPSGGAVGDTWASEAIFAFKNTVASSVVEVGGTSYILGTLADSSMNSHVSVTASVNSGGTATFNVTNGTTASLDVTMKVSITFN